LLDYKTGVEEAVKKLARVDRRILLIALGGRVYEQLAFALSKRLRVADSELRVLEER